MPTRERTKTLTDAVEDAHAGKPSTILCPAHEDKEPSLSVAPGGTPKPGQRAQPVVLNCHAGCETPAIIEAGGIEWADIMDDDPDASDWADTDRWTPAGRASFVYPYRDSRGILLFEVMRVNTPGGGKRIFQRRPEPTNKHGHVWDLEGVERVIYRLPEVVKAVRAGRTIHVAEGESCVHALLRVIPKGDEATCNPMGAGKWEDHYSEALAGANVVVYADADEPGRAHARRVRESLIAQGCTVRVLEPPPGLTPAGKAINDVADHIAAGRASAQLLETTPAEERERTRTGVDLLDLILRPRGTTEYVIPHTLAKGERLLLVGFEGTGKSTLCRQIGVMVAAGLHPWLGTEIEPRRVLYIDAENHPDQVDTSWQNLVDLAAKHGRPIERDRMIVMEEWESEIGLDGIEGALWLQERVHAYMPDLVVLGPLTNLSNRDLRDDEPVRRLRNAVNQARSICNSAFVMEHHAPHKGPMDKVREARPYGSSLFLKWPDYGYAMKPYRDVEGLFEWYKNRGPRVRSRIWPDHVREGQGGMEWPWMQAVVDDNGNVIG